MKYWKEIEENKYMPIRCKEAIVRTNGKGLIRRMIFKDYEDIPIANTKLGKVQPEISSIEMLTVMV